MCQVAVSGEVARRIEAPLVAELSGRFLSIGRGVGAIEVTLAPGEEQLAGELTRSLRKRTRPAGRSPGLPDRAAVSVCTVAPAANPSARDRDPPSDTPRPIVADGHGWPHLEATSPTPLTPRSDSTPVLRSVRSWMPAGMSSPALTPSPSWTSDARRSRSGRIDRVAARLQYVELRPGAWLRHSAGRLPDRGRDSVRRRRAGVSSTTDRDHRPTQMRNPPWT